MFLQAHTKQILPGLYWLTVHEFIAPEQVGVDGLETRVHTVGLAFERDLQQKQLEGVLRVIKEIQNAGYTGDVHMVEDE